jgi:hypothetical protein
MRLKVPKKLIFLGNFGIFDKNITIIFTFMASKKNTETNEEKTKEYKEGELVLLFKLNRITTYYTPLLQEWLEVENPVFDVGEQSVFDRKVLEAQKHLAGWSEEDLKMKFIAAIIDLGHLVDGDGIVTLFDKKISATVEGTKLTVKSDFMIAKGYLDFFSLPYFHFQEYKPNKNPSGDSMAQLLEAFMIAQQKNKNNKPLYGIEVMGKQWTFVVMEGKEYCTSKSYDSLDKDDLLKIIAILRKFKHILFTRLMLD